VETVDLRSWFALTAIIVSFITFVFSFVLSRRSSQAAIRPAAEQGQVFNFDF
jgi:hypothetical protein